MKKLLFSLFILVLALAVIAPACTSSTEDNTAAFCNSLQNLANAEAQVRSINISTPVDQARQYQDNLQNAWNDVVDAKGNLTVSKYADLENSYNQLKSSLDSISGEQSVAQALPSIQSALVTFQADLNEIRTTVCQFTPTGTP